jgi:hypothetical protein
MTDFVKAEKFWLRDHPTLNEKWVQEQIAADPSMLGLGKLVLRDKERAQPHAGRLDLLLQDPESNRRYEVEVQLGKTDESHIIRTLEYWDIERKRYPQYDHCAVIVAEDITARFLNRDFPDGVRPTTAVGLSDEFITDREIGKRIFCSVDEVSSHLGAEVLPTTAAGRASVAGRDRPSPSPPCPPAVSPVVGLIAAPSQAGVAVESAPGWPGTACGARRPRPSGRRRTEHVERPWPRSSPASPAASSATSA